MPRINQANRKFDNHKLLFATACGATNSILTIDLWEFNLKLDGENIYMRPQTFTLIFGEANVLLTA